jgi:hypothetical protein
MHPVLCLKERCAFDVCIGHNKRFLCFDEDRKT